jgi:hypothetical protein
VLEVRGMTTSSFVWFDWLVTFHAKKLLREMLVEIAKRQGEFDANVAGFHLCHWGTSKMRLAIPCFQTLKFGV